MTHDVFITYSSRNKEYADTACEKLEEDGVNCWIAPRNIPPGSNYAEEIINGLNNAKVLVLIFSKDAQESKYVNNEINTAFSAGKSIIAFRIDDSFPSGRMEFFLRNSQWLDASPTFLKDENNTIETCYDQLVESVKLTLKNDSSLKWTLVEGSNNTYYKKHALSVKKVTEDNYFEYYLMDSKESVENNSASYFHDNKSKKIYLHPRKNSDGDEVTPNLLNIVIESDFERPPSPPFIKRYKVPIIAVMIVLIAISGFILANSMNNQTTTDEVINETSIDIGYIGLEDYGGGNYAYYVFGTVSGELNSSKDVIHIDYIDESGKVVDTSDTKVKDMEGNILGSIDVSKKDVVKVSVELQDKSGKVIQKVESKNIIEQ